LKRDLRFILGAQGLRAFAYGLGSILVGDALGSAGFSSAQAGAVFTAMLAGMALSTVIVGRVGERIGRRRLYCCLFVLMGATGTVFALTRSLWLLVLAALTGTMSTDPNESGPLTSIEQAMIGEAPGPARVGVFGRYNAVAYLAGAAGALAAGGPQALRRIIPAVPANQKFLLVFPVVGLACALLGSRLSEKVEAGGVSDRPPAPPLTESKKVVRRLGALFALDSFGGGFIVQTFLVYWFKRRFGVSVDAMGLLFFGAGLLQAISSILAGRLAGKIGLLNTMVFTHLPSNVLLMLVPLAPTFPVAAALLLARFALSQMDVPARQAYVAALVRPGERTAAAAYTNSARYFARPLGPALGGALMQAVAVGAPLVGAGLIKICYDLAIFRLFRKTPLDPEAPPTLPEAASSQPVPNA